MIDLRRCDCDVCRSRRIALRIFIAWVVAVLIFGLSERVSAETIQVCEKVELPGKAYTLNPNAPPKKRVQATVRVCWEAEVPSHRPRGPIMDPRRDIRAIA